MALVNCPECGTEVSQKAFACVKCGYPIAAHDHAPSDKAQGYEDEQEPRSSESENSVDEGVGIDMVMQLEACFARRSHMLLASLGVLILLTSNLIAPLVADGFLKALDGFGVTFNDQRILKFLVACSMIVSSVILTRLVVEFLADREFFYRPQEINWDKVSRLDSAEDSSLRCFWDGLPKRYGSVFFNMRLSPIKDFYVIHYEFRVGFIVLGVIANYFLKGLLFV